jgi:signal transduction histidine kinase
MRDRITAIGGTLTVDSEPAQGTRLHGSVPDP